MGFALVNGLVMNIGKILSNGSFQCLVKNTRSSQILTCVHLLVVKIHHLILVKATSTAEQTSVNLINSLKIQPGVSVHDAINGSNFVNSTWINYFTVVPGYYITKSPANDSRGFSILYHFIQRWTSGPYRTPYFFYDTYKKVEFLDLALTGAPGRYEIGIGLIVQKNGSFQCAYAKDPHAVNLMMVYETFWGPMFLTAFILCVVLQILLIIVVYACKFKSEEKLTSSKSMSQLSSDQYFQAPSGRRSFSKRNPIHDMFYAMFLMPDTELITHIGTEAFYFFRFHRIYLWSLSGFTLVSVALMFADGFADPNVINSRDVSKLSIAVLNPGEFTNNFRSQSMVIIAHLVASFLFICIAFAMNTFILRLARTILPKKEEFSAEQSVQIQHVPLNVVDDESLLDHFRIQFSPYDVLKVHIAYDLSKLKEFFDRKKKCEDQINHLQNSKSKKFKFQFWLDSSETIEKKIKEKRDEITDLNFKISFFKEKIDIKGTGTVFVTFVNKDLAKKCIQSYSDQKWMESHKTQYSDSFKTKKWILDKPPKPHTIFWENLGYSEFWRWMRKLAGNMILVFGFICAGTFGIIVSSSSLMRSAFRSALGWYAEQTNTWIQNIISGYQVFLELGPLWSLVILFTTIPLVAKNVEWQKHRTSTQERRAFSNSFLFYLYLNTLIIPRVFVTFLGVSISFWSVAPFNTYDYMILQMHPDLINLILLAGFALKALDIIIQFIILIKQAIFQKEIVRSGYAYTMGYTSLIFSILLVLYFGSTMTIIAPVTLAYYIVSYYVEKWMILYYYARSDIHDGQFLRQVVRSFIYYILLFPLFLTGFLCRYFGIPFFVWIGLTTIIIICGVILFRFIDRRVKNDRLILKDNRVALLKFEKSSIINEYRHPLYEYYKDEIEHVTHHLSHINDTTGETFEGN